MTLQQFNLSAMTASAALLLSACGSGGGDDDVVLRQQIELNSAQVSLQPLKETTTTSFATHLKNGLYTASINQIINASSGCNNCEATSTPSTDTGSSAGVFSQTNTQEAGVDEADRVEYDGEHLYIAAHPYYDPITDNGSQSDYIKIMQRQEDTSFSQINALSLPDGFNSVEGMYVAQNKLAALGRTDAWFDTVPFDVWHPIDQKVNLAVYDVQNPQTPELAQYISFDGHLLSSRRVDNKLYLVSSFSPSVAGLNYSASSDAEKQLNYDLIQGADINQLMPKMTLTNNSVQNLVEPQSCFIPQDATNVDGYESIVTLTTIDLNQPNDIQSVCINTVTDGIYASSKAIYLLGTTYDQHTVINKFSIDNVMGYVGVGVVEGNLAWRNPSFRLSEYQDKLRVVATNWQNGQQDHRLYILDAQAQNKKLNIISQLPNDQHPEPIGKPNEDIYAVRYFNEKAYIVTFERIDPLYVLDLSDVADPKIAGALEVPGYSAYLHPITENLLLGVGQQIDPNRFPGNGQPSSTDTSPIDEGAKVALFDVSDPTNPVELGSVVYTDGFTPVEWDHHALTYLPMSENHYRFALPVSFWQLNENIGLWAPTNTLQMLEVNVTESGAQLVEKTPMMAEDVLDDYYYIDSNSDRSIMHDDAVYYIHGNHVWQSLWDN
jgi:hypothetical protein